MRQYLLPSIIPVGFMLMEITEITDVVAWDTWTSTGQDGNAIAHEIVVGRPFQDPDDAHGDWVCPVSIQHFTPRIVPAYGVGPVDALMNAMILVKEFFNKINQGKNPTNDSL